MSAALDMLRAFAQTETARASTHERNEIDETTQPVRPVSSLNSLISFSPSLDSDQLAERAALVEFGAGVPRQWAEGFARLDPVQPPADVPPDRWQTFVDDVGRFLDGGFAASASRLGWGSLDLFGA